MVKIVNSDDNGHIFCCLMVLKMLGYRRGGGMAGETVAEHRIAMALLGLLNVKAFDRISITEITEKAAVSRVSYYRHFSSKEDILLRHSSYILDGIVDDLKSGKLCSGSEFWQRLFTELSDTNLTINMSKAGLEDEFFSIFEHYIQTFGCLQKSRTSNCNYCHNGSITSIGGFPGTIPITNTKNTKPKPDTAAKPSPPKRTPTIRQTINTINPKISIKPTLS